MSVVHRSHRFVCLPLDIVHELIGLLSRGQATRTARVCKSWSEISLDVVWKGPVHFLVLASLLGKVVYRNNIFEDAWDLKFPPTVAARQRFAYYANRIRFLRLPFSRPGRFILEEIKSLLSGGPLLPNLQRVSGTPPAFVYLGLSVLHDRVLKVEMQEDKLVPDAPVSHVVNFHQSLITLIPNVQRLSMGGMHRLTVPQLSSFATSLLTLANLEYLTMGNIRPLTGIVHILARHSNLKTVILGSNSYYSRIQTLLDPKNLPQGKLVFSNLEHLSAVMHIGTETATLLADIRESHSIKWLVISDADSHQPANPAERDLLSVCRGISRHDRLQRLHLERLSDNITFDRIVPILRCPLIEDLTIDVNARIFLNDEDILALAMALPLLQTLKLALSHPAKNNTETSNLSLRSISHLVAGCPDLSSIEMIVDATRDIPGEKEVAAADFRARNALTLVIARSPIDEDNIDDIAFFLTTLGVRQVIQIEPGPWDVHRDSDSDSDDPLDWGVRVSGGIEEYQDYGLNIWGEVQAILEGEESPLGLLGS